METESEKKQYHERRKKANKLINTLSYLIVVAIIVLLIGVEVVILIQTDSFSMIDLIKETAMNLLGVLVAFLIFDVIHDKLSKDSYADEVSEKIRATLFDQEGIDDLSDDVKKVFITKSLLSLGKDRKAAEDIAKALEKYFAEESGNESVLNQITNYSEEHKRDMINSNVKSIANDELKESMVRDFLDIYLDGQTKLRLRTQFDYGFILQDIPHNIAFEKFNFGDKYFLVQETLFYEIKFLADEINNMKEPVVKIGFPFNMENLDAFLRDNQTDDDGNVLKGCIFRESLDVDAEKVQLFKDLDAKGELKDCFLSLFTPDIRVDKKQGELVEVKAYDCGLVASFKTGHETYPDMHSVQIQFQMPKRWNGLLEVAMVDPTHNPRIRINYTDDMKVEMYSFLDICDGTSYENAHSENGRNYNIVLNDTWVYPVSGVLFSVNKKNV